MVRQEDWGGGRDHGEAWEEGNDRSTQVRGGGSPVSLNIGICIYVTSWG